jgi:hypothetical protein
VKVKPLSLDLYASLSKLDFWGSPRRISLAGEWCWNLVPGKPVVSAFGHDEGDATSAAHLLEGLVEVPLGTTTPMLGRNPWFFLRTAAALRRRSPS